MRYLEIDKQRDARFETEVTEKVVDHTTDQFYTDIVLFNGGSKALEIYKALHPRISRAEAALNGPATDRRARPPRDGSEQFGSGTQAHGQI